MNVLVVSNGHGEDLIALKLIKALKESYPKAKFKAFPVVGNGDVYKANYIPLCIQNPTFPSGGFIRGLKDLINDLNAGLLTHLFKQLSTMKKEAKSADLTLAVGDFFCLLMARHRNKSPIYFLPTAKSDTFMPHNNVEYAIIKRFAKAVFPRDQITTDSFNARNISAHYFGNPMMDDLDTPEAPLPFKQDDTVIGILPGSRHEAYENLKKMTPILKIALKKDPNLKFCIAKAPSLDESKIKNLLGSLPIHITPHFIATLHYSQAVIGLAGTANEQAAFLGLPVICFEGTGPQTTKKRFLEQQKLMGDRIMFQDTQSPDIIAQALLDQLKPPPIAKKQEAAKDIVQHIINALK